MTQSLTISLPKEGRLPDCFNILAGADLTINKPFNRSGFGFIQDPLGMFQDSEVIMEKQTDMFASLRNYGVDAAIMGRDKFMEYTAQDRQNQIEARYKITARFKRCAPAKLKIIGETTPQSPQDLTGARIATSYPALLQEWLKSKNIQGTQVEMKSSAVEDTIRQGRAIRQWKSPLNG